MTPPPDSRIRLLARVMFAAGLLLLIFSKIPLSDVARSIGAEPAGLFLSALVLFASTFPLLALKWKTLLPEESFLALLKMILIGHFYSLAFPGQVAGEISKALILEDRNNSRERILASVVVDKITGFLSLLAVGLCGILFSAETLPPYLSLSLGGGIALFLALLFSFRIDAVFAFSSRMIARIGGRGASVRRLSRSALALIADWHEYSKKTGALSMNLGLGVAYTLINVFIYVILSGALGIPVGFSDWCWVSAALSLILFLPLTLGGLGVREGTLIGILGSFGVISSVSVALSLSIFLLQVLFAVLGGALELYRQLYPRRRTLS